MKKCNSTPRKAVLAGVTFKVELRTGIGLVLLRSLKKKTRTRIFAAKNSAKGTQVLTGYDYAALTHGRQRLTFRVQVITFHGSIDVKCEWRPRCRAPASRYYSCQGRCDCRATESAWAGGQAGVVMDVFSATWQWRAGPKPPLDDAWAVVVTDLHRNDSE